MKILSAGADPKSFQFLKNNGYVIQLLLIKKSEKNILIGVKSKIYRDLYKSK